MSNDEKRFLKMANEAVLQNSYNCLKLLLRNTNISMPNYHHLAVQRLQILKGKSNKKPQFKQEYVLFLNDIFENNYT